VHILHSSMSDLYRMLLLRFIRSECVGNKSGNELKEIDVRSAANLRPLSEMDIGENTKQTLATVKQEKHKGLLMDMQHFYKTCAESLRSSLPLASTLLQDLHCLHPQARSQLESEQCIRRLAKKLRQIVETDEITTVVDEWKLQCRAVVNYL
jgi:endonuclease IV